MTARFAHITALAADLEDALRRRATVDVELRGCLAGLLGSHVDGPAAGVQVLAIATACARLCGHGLFEVEQAMHSHGSLHEVIELSGRDAEICAMCVALDRELEAAQIGGDELSELQETLLAAQAPTLRRRIGAYHTPADVARFVIRELDRVLVGAGLQDGLVDESSYADLGLPPPPGLSSDAAFLRLLEPAVGSGMFLRELLRHVVEVHGRERLSSERMASLLSRVRAYELLPAVALQCRLQLRSTLFELGYDPALSDLTMLQCGDFLQAAVEEHPVLLGVNVVFGNPPYARASQHRSDAMREWLAPYRAGLADERNLQPLADDYIKFVRAIEVVTSDAPLAAAGLVTNHTFLRGKLHRGMRQSLRRSFDHIAITDLHGNSKVRVSGERDENVFGISQGVAVSVMARAPRAARAGVVYRELRGRRTHKLSCLAVGDLPALRPVPCCDIAFAPSEPLPREYEAFVSLRDLFEFYSVGGKPGDDRTLVGFEAEELLAQLRRARNALSKIQDGATEAGRRLSQRPVERPFEPEGVIRYTYRPFDDRVAYYEPEIWTRPLRALYERVDGRPILLTTRIVKDERFAHVFATRRFPDVIALSTTSSVNCYAFPLATMKPERLCSAMGLSLNPEEAFAYVYGALHSEAYRARYIGGLRQDFPRVPIMRDPALVASLVARGLRLLALHLGEAKPKSCPPRFVDGGDRRIVYGVPEDPSDLASGDDGLRLGLNDRSYFAALSKEAWSFRVGGYQVCRKWLLDRRRAGRELSDDDIRSYCDMVAAVQETQTLQGDIDALIERFGGFPEVVQCEPSLG